MRDITTILDIISTISSTLALDEILAEFTEKTAYIVGADSCAILEWHGQDDTIVVLAGYVAPNIPFPADETHQIGSISSLSEHPASAQVLHGQTSLIIYKDDPSADPIKKNILEQFGWDGVLLVPMLYKEQAIGLLEVYTKNKRHYQFSDEDVIFCQALANQAAVAIENARLYQQAEEGRLHAEAMQVISRVLASELDYERIVHNVASFAYRLVNAQFVYLAVPEADGFRPVALAGHEGHSYNSSPRLSRLPGQDILTKAAQGPIVVPDLERDPAFTQQPQTKEITWRTVVAVPLLSYDQLLGVLAAYADQPHFFVPNDIAILMSLASQGAVAIQNARLFKELKTQREQLQHLSLRLVNAQEEERRRISRELHDELGQSLTALKINLDMGRHALPIDAPPKLLQSLQEASSLAIQTLETARNLSLELHPAILDDLGLVSALRWEIDRYEQRTNQTVHFKAELGEVVLKPELEITLYRIIMEALTNVSRHAQASHIAVRLTYSNNKVRAEIEDDGVGFITEGGTALSERQSLGLVSMRERTGLLGGTFELTSQPGQGTLVNVQFPTAA